MIDWNKIKRYTETIKKNKEKLELETDFVRRERIRMKLKILELRVKLEKLI
jgi:hypothetical protein